jgi:hypothetical protein
MKIDVAFIEFYDLTQSGSSEEKRDNHRHVPHFSKGLGFVPTTRKRRPHSSRDRARTSPILIHCYDNPFGNVCPAGRFTSNLRGAASLPEHKSLECFLTLHIMRL